MKERLLSRLLEILGAQNLMIRVLVSATTRILIGLDDGGVVRAERMYFCVSNQEISSHLSTRVSTR